MELEKIHPNTIYRNMNLLRKLTDYEEKDKITLLLDEYNKKVEKDYFLTQRNIRIGRLNTNPEKTRANPFTYHLQSPKKTIHQNQRRQVFLGDTSLNSYNNNLNLYKRSTTLSSRKMNRIMQNPDSSNNSKKNIIDNNDLKRLYNDIRNRINNYKNKKKLKKKFYIEIPLNIRNCLYKQEKLFKKIKKEKNNKKLNEENIKLRTKNLDINDFLINKSSSYNKKNLEIQILDKNMTKENKYRNNLWNITLRNYAQNGKYEKLGYLNIGNNYEPRYTFFNMNHNLVYFNKPSSLKAESVKNNKNNKDIFFRMDDNLYSLKTKQNLNYLNNIQNLEVNGQNLLNFEESRERKIKGNKIMHKNEYLEYLLNKKINKGKGPDELYEEKIYAENYNGLDFMKNINLNSKNN